MNRYKEIIIFPLFIGVLFLYSRIPGQSSVGVLGVSFFVGILAFQFVNLIQYDLCPSVNSFFERRKLLRNIGTETLAIYAIHWCIFFYPHFIHWEYVSFGMVELAKPAIVSILWIGGCYLVIFIVRKSKLARKLFLGDKI